VAEIREIGITSAAPIIHIMGCHSVLLQPLDKRDKSNDSE
jgi:hypothetical protein